MVQAVSRRPLTMEARARARVSPRQICDLQSGTGTGLSQSSSAFDCQHHSTLTLHAHLGDEQKARWWPQFRDILTPST
jgi:hypothetical protein